MLMKPRCYELDETLHCKQFKAALYRCSIDHITT